MMMTRTTTRPATPSRYRAAKRPALSLRPARPAARIVVTNTAFAPPRPVETSGAALLDSRSIGANASSALTLTGAFATIVFASLLLFCRAGLGPNGYLSYATIALGMAAWLLRDVGAARSAASAG
jgi:hypothetical protein